MPFLTFGWRSFDETDYGKRFEERMEQNDLKTAVEIFVSSNTEDDAPLSKLLTKMNFNEMETIQTLLKSRYRDKLIQMGLGSNLVLKMPNTQQAISAICKLCVETEISSLSSKFRSDIATSVIADPVVSKCKADFLLFLLKSLPKEVKRNIKLSNWITNMLTYDKDLVCQIMLCVASNPTLQNVSAFENVLPALLIKFEENSLYHISPPIVSELLNQSECSSSLTTSVKFVLEGGDFTHALIAVLDAFELHSGRCLEILSDGTLSTRRIASCWPSLRPDMCGVLTKNIIKKFVSPEWLAEDETLANGTTWTLVQANKCDHIVPLVIEELTSALSNLSSSRYVDILVAICQCYYETHSKSTISAFLKSDSFTVLLTQLGVEPKNSVTWYRIYNIIYGLCREQHVRSASFEKFPSLLLLLCHTETMDSHNKLLRMLIETTIRNGDESYLKLAIVALYCHLETADELVFKATLQTLSDTVTDIAADENFLTQKARYRLQLLLAVEGQCLKSWCATPLVSEEMVKAVVTAYQIFTKGNVDACNHFHTKVSSQKFVSYLLSQCATASSVEFCLGLLQLNGEDCLHTDFLYSFISACPSKWIDVVFERLSSILERSRFCCFQLGSSAAFRGLLTHFADTPTNQKLFRCLSLAMQEYVATSNIKNLFLQVMKRADRSALSAQVLSLIRGSLIPIPPTAPRQSLSFFPNSGPSGLKVRLPKAFESGFTLKYQFAVRKAHRYIMLEVKGFESNKRDFSSVSLSFENNTAIIKLDGKNLEVHQQPKVMFNEWNMLSITVQPSKIVAVGRIVVDINQQIIFDIQLSFTISNLQLVVGNTFQGFTSMTEDTAFRGTIGPMFINSLSEDAEYCRIIPKPFYQPKCVVLASTKGTRAIGVGVLSSETRPLVDRILTLGVFPVVLFPLLSLLSNPRLPFNSDHFANVTEGFEEQGLIEALNIVSFLVQEKPQVRQEVSTTDYFSFLSMLLMKHVGVLTELTTEKLVVNCSDMLNCGELFEASVSSLLFNLQFLQGLKEEPRVSLLERMIDISNKVAIRSKLRSCGVFKFVAHAIPCFSGESDFEVRDLLLRLVDSQLADRLSSDEVRDLVFLFANMTRSNITVSLELASLCSACLEKKVLVEVLATTDLEAVFVGMLDRPEEGLRVEGLKLFIQLVGQSKSSDRQLSFLASKLTKFGMNMALYQAIKDACSKLASGKRKKWLLNWPNLILPTLALAEDAEQQVRCEVFTDLVNVLSSDNSIAWASIIKLPCWYVSTCDLIFHDEDADVGVIMEPLVSVFSKALRSCTFYEKELRQTMAYLTLRKKLSEKSHLAIRLLRDARAFDSTAPLMISNSHRLLSIVEEYLMSEFHSVSGVAKEYLEVITLPHFASRFFKESGYSMNTTLFLQICLRCPQFGVDEATVYTAMNKVVSMSRKQFQAVPDWLTVSAKYRLVVLASAYVLAVSRSYKSLERLCREHVNAVGVKEKVTEAFLTDSPRFISNSATAFEALPNIPEIDDGKAIGLLHTQISDANLEKDNILKSYDDTLLTIEVLSMKSSCISIKAGDEAWSEFVRKCPDTIWRASQPAVKFLRQLPKEQTRLRSLKLTRDPKGTDHADVSSRTDIRSDGARRPTHLANTTDVVEESEESEEVSSEESDEEFPMETAVLACELIQQIHCFSSDLKLSEKKIEIQPTEENTSYNQAVSKSAQKYVAKPSKMTWPFANLTCVCVGRRYRMQRTAMELRFSDLSVVMLNFTHETYRVALARFKRLGAKIEDPEKQALQAARRRITERWRVGEMSNFDYLMELNYWAGRSVQDLSQYPVFPWVVSDYTSKELDLGNPATFRDLRNPIGWTGTESRAEELQMRFSEMQCHYFQHYSSPAVVLYYMLRLEPYTTMHIIFQGGRFDHADRLFYSVSSAWAGVRQNLQDVKELIPEFYYLPEAFQNHNGVHLGCRQDGSMINYLELPPWANASPYEFVYRLRMALESDFVSSSLHHWIDLIFGYKQRGEEAVKAKNVFHPDTYEPKLTRKPTTIELEVINSVDTVGQVPMQLFKKGHPEKLNEYPTGNWNELNATYLTVVPSDSTSSPIQVLHLYESVLFVLRDDGRVYSYPIESTPLLGKPTRRFRAQTTRSFDVIQDETFVLPSLEGIVFSTATSVAILPIGASAYVVQGGLSDNMIALRCLTPDKVQDTDRPTRYLAGHSDIVTKVIVAEDSQTVVTVGKDDTIIVWTIDEAAILKAKFSIKCHLDEVLDEACSTTMDMVASSSANGCLLVHSVATGELEWSDTHPQLGDFNIVRLAPSCYIPHLLVHSRSDSATRQYSINGVLLRVLTHDRIIIDIFPLAGGCQSTVFSCVGKVVMHHSFLFDTLLAHDVEEDVVSVTSHPRNPQMLLLGSNQGTVSLLRAEIVDSPRK